ncbi:XRE family transcriptional regulator [Sphingomonas aracearum]|uniref:Helix-turn-helix transcriptional regulator n=1 Tax=Sphingomonas aracearum TaxID=2283317 RepID=A0A369VRL6_9SPHN|nr:S24 family peptidase [Sphingomonas aracearum]RDE04673.1 helix-turn-helix transcriptional regulator [Sphingomonas aracearum]
MIVMDRLAARMRELGLSQAELARRVGISQQAIGKLVNGKSSSSPNIGRIAEVLQTTPAYLVGQVEDPEEGAMLMPTEEVIADQLDLVAIDEIDLAFGLGATLTDQVPVVVSKRRFPRGWLEALTDAPPSALVFARGRGDSMLPTLLDGDIVLIDKTQRSFLEQDALFALTLGDAAMIKRLRARPSGRIAILSDNPTVPADEVAPDEIRIVGRVVFIGRRM